MSEQDKRPDDDGMPPQAHPEHLDVPEPDLQVTADEVALQEPTLSQARVSDETAHEADLASAAADAQAVEKEADAAGQLVGGKRNEDTAKARGTAPAGASAGDQGAAEPAAASPAEGEPPAPDAGKAAEPATAAIPPADWAPAPASTDGSAPEKNWYSTGKDSAPADSTPADSTGGKEAPASPGAGQDRKTDWKPLVIIGAVVIVAVVIIVMIVSSLTSGSPAGGAASPSSSHSAAETANADGVVAEDVSPFDFQQGQCFTEFEAVMRHATVVTCDTPHKAQLVGTFSYGEDEEFPGADELNMKAEDVCTAVVLNDSAADHPDLKDSYGMPSEETWAQGDRRIDCFKIAVEGEQLTGSLVD